VLALAQGTVDVAVNWWNAADDSNLTRMLEKGMLKNADGSPMTKGDFRIILASGLIINAPYLPLGLAGRPEGRDRQGVPGRRGQ
jgi:phosphonate transport system substrate-binding protein